jgi:aspartyl-tRNA(Asn)/glutamyl-tRNA(Gln) amidotransferase subunit A
MAPDDLSLRAVSDRIRERQSSAVQAVSLFLDRIAKVDSRIHAWTTVDAEGALEQAEVLDKELGQGRYRGPLHGVPIGIKDIFNTRGIRTTMGSPLFENHMPDHDAAVVQQLREAGAIILGKTVTTEFAALDPGPTRNPWNLEHTPGGSSSGSAAAVAARMCPSATGSQTAGSIGRPAAFCGIVGLMPTASLISREGVFPNSWSLDHIGAFGRTVDDVSIMTSAMSGQAPGNYPDIDAPDIRIGVVREFFRENTDPEAWGHHEQLIERLKEAGPKVEELSLPDSFSKAIAALRTIMRVELAAAHSKMHAEHSDDYGANLRGLVESGLLISATQYLRARRLRIIYQKEMRQLFTACDVILSPGARGPAPRGLGSTGDPVISAPWTLADFPTLSVPTGLGPGHLPAGVQLSALPLNENRLITVGKWFEQWVEFRELPELKD